MAYAEFCTDEKAATAIAVFGRAVGWFAERGVTVECVRSDNGAGLPVIRLAHDLYRAGRHPEANPPVPTTNPRKDRKIPPPLADEWAYA
jgi:hypothetical protein